MKRMHLHLGVDDMDQSIAFYSALFAAEPTVRKDDYAKWMLEDPRINFAITPTTHTAKGIEHIGIQVDNVDELNEVGERLKSAGRPVLNEAATTCCYAQSTKNWITDPDGVIWETFLTTGGHVEYGNKEPVLSGMAQLAALETAKANASANDSCCTPSQIA
ncbi:MAG: ArsI/CadI family heavy metal resistance metalloenzyme [Casimicrobium sp.]